MPAGAGTAEFSPPQPTPFRSALLRQAAILGTSLVAFMSGGMSTERVVQPAIAQTAESPDQSNGGTPSAEEECSEFRELQQSSTVPAPSKYIPAEKKCIIATFKSNPDNQGFEYWGPSDKNFGSEVSSVRRDTRIDPIRKLSFRLNRSTGTITTRILQQEARETITMAVFRKPEDEYFQDLRKFERSINGDAMYDQRVVAAYMLRSARGGKPKRIGRAVLVPKGDSENIFNLSLDPAQVDEDTLKKDSTVTIKPSKPLPQSVLGSREGRKRIYVEVGQQSIDRDNPGNTISSRVLARAYRVDKSRSYSGNQLTPNKTTVINTSTVVNTSRKTTR